MIIKIPVRYEGSNGEKVLYTLFDSGSAFSCIHPDHVKEIAEPNKIRKPLRVATASADSCLVINERISTDFYIQDIRMSDEFMVVPGLSEDVIIGATTMQKWRLKLDFEHDMVIVDPRVAQVILYDLKFCHHVG
jgi:hypothetical protein